MEKRILFIGIDTTGLTPKEDEIVRFCAVNNDGMVEADYSMIPKKPKGCTVSDCSGPTLDDCKTDIIRLIQTADVVIGYHIDFVLDFLHIHAELKLTDKQQVISVISEFGAMYAKQNDCGSDYRWKSLKTASDYYGYHLLEANCLDRVMAVRYIYMQMLDEKKGSRSYHDKLQFINWKNADFARQGSAYRVYYDRVHIGDPKSSCCRKKQVDPNGADCLACGRFYDFCYMDYAQDPYDAYVIPDIDALRAYEVDHRLQDDVYEVIRIFNGDNLIKAFLIQPDWWDKVQGNYHSDSSSHNIAGLDKLIAATDCQFLIPCDKTALTLR